MGNSPARKKNGKLRGKQLEVVWLVRSRYVLAIGSFSMLINVSHAH